MKKQNRLREGQIDALIHVARTVNSHLELDDVLRSIDRGKPLALTAPGGPIIRALDGYLQEVVRGRDPMPTLASPGRGRPGGRQRRGADS